MRNASFDAIRGIAACIVVFCHSLLVFDTNPLPIWVLKTPLRLLVSGSAAVVVFFVLSGAVLSLGFTAGSGPRYTSFASKRTTRIYVPFAIAIIISLLLQTILHPAPVAGASQWLNYGTWDQPPTVAQIAKTFLMTGTYSKLDNPMWSLVHELRVSFVFPILVLLVRLNWRITVVGSAILCIGCVYAPSSLTNGGLVSVIRSGVYVIAFVAGIALGLNLTTIRSWIISRSRATRFALWLVALCGLLNAPLESGRITTSIEVVEFLINVAAAFLLLSMASGEDRITRALRQSLPLFLGKISYSLYLTHVIVIAAVVHTMPVTVTIGVKVLTGLALTLPIAIVFHYSFERFATQIAGFTIAPLRILRSACARHLRPIRQPAFQA